MLRIVCFAEAAADARLGSALGDRVMVEEGPEWVDADLLSALREWTGLEHVRSFTKWTEIGQAKGQPRRPRYFGHPASGPRGSDFAIGVKALTQVALLADRELQDLAVVMLRDCDATGDKREGLRQAAAAPRFAALNAVIGIADKMREAWVLNGFSPITGLELQALRRAQQELGFDPTCEAERLRAADKSDPRHPKRVLAELTGGDPDREMRCWAEPDLNELRKRGVGTGLAAFLDELRERLLPLISGDPIGSVSLGPR